jgi:hypothetical protein
MATRAHTVPRFYLNGFLAPESEGSADPYVWLGSLDSGEIKRRSPKNISISRGLYDGPGGFDDASKSIEKHLAQIEAAAAPAIRAFAATARTDLHSPAPEVWRLLAWQAARTPGWLNLVQKWVNEWNPDSKVEPIEPPPDGFENTKDRNRSCCVEDPRTGERRETRGLQELKEYRKLGWNWILRSDDQLELMHTQAWYFQARHFPRLSWARLNAPDDEWFITSDRAVAWLVDGFADTPPAALRHPSAQVVAALTRKVALVGRHEATKLNVTPREVNRFIASAASAWIAGPTKRVVEQAIEDRTAIRPH